MLQQLENPRQGSVQGLWSFPVSPCSAVLLLTVCACCSADTRGRLLGEQKRSSAAWPRHNVLMLAASFPAWLIWVQRVKLQLDLL